MTYVSANCLLLVIQLIVMFILFYKRLILLMLSEQLCHMFTSIGNRCFSHEIQCLVSLARVRSHPFNSHFFKGVSKRSTTAVWTLQKGRSALFYLTFRNKHFLASMVGLNPSSEPNILHLSWLSQNFVQVQEEYKSAVPFALAHSHTVQACLHPLLSLFRKSHVLVVGHDHSFTEEATKRK